MGLFKSKVFLGTVIMTVFSLAVRILGFAFRIFLSNRIGAEGMGQYQLVTSVYQLAATLVTSGIGVAVTRLTAEWVSRRGLQTAKSTVTTALAVTGVLGMGVGAVLFFFAPVLTRWFLYDEELVTTLRILGPCMPFIAWCACFSGYFYGIRRVLPAAFTQLLEQLVRMGVVFFGITAMGEGSITARVTVAILSISLGEILSCLYIAFRFRFSEGVQTEERTSIRELLEIALPVAANGYLNALLRMVENVLIPKLFLKSGMDLKESLSLFGLIKGMVLPVMHLPCALISALSVNLMPALAAAYTQRNHKKIRMAVEKSLSIALAGGILMVGILVTFPNELGQALYHSQEAGVLFCQMAFICPLIYLEIVLVGALNSLGLQRVAFKNSLVDSAVKLTIMILGVPKYGFSAYLLAVGASCVVSVGLNFSGLLKRVSVVLDARRFIICPLSAFVSATLVQNAIKIAEPQWGTPLWVQCTVFSGVYAATLLILWFGLKQKSR